MFLTNQFIMKKTITFFAFISFVMLSIAQKDTLKIAKDTAKIFTISAEFRPRAEYRNGYRELNSDTSDAAFFIEQRSRIYLDYRAPRFIWHTSIQDIRIWGEQDPRSTGGTLQLFETYVEPSITKRISVRIGRQKVMYDNQRLFAQNDWRQNGGTHDAVRFIYKGLKLEADLIGAFNQGHGAQDKFSNIDYNPGFANYKTLFVNFLKYKFSDALVLTLINSNDGFQDAIVSEKINNRFTSGGRVEYTKKNLYLTLAGYSQYGKETAGKKLDAFYFQPEAKLKLKKYFTFRLGAEIFSGDNAKKPSTTSRSFDALYGVNHRFLGTMDFFTRFPKDFNNAGIVNPYFFTVIDFNKKVSLKVEQHLFFSQNNFIVNNEVINKYLGYENDLLLIYKPNATTELQLGYSFAFLTKSMEYIKKSGNSDLWQEWAYLMVTFTPQFLKIQK
jgi:hypothetical protein